MRQIIVLAAAALTGMASADRARDAWTIFDKAVKTVDAHFYDRSFRGLPWPDLVNEARSRLTPESSDEDLQRIVNALLSRLNASHTEFLSDRDQAYWVLKSVFSHRLKGARLCQIGAWFEARDHRWFARSVFAGSPAEKAGLGAGDEILAVDGRPLEPVRSFSNCGAAARMDIRRSENGPLQSLGVRPVRESFQESMLRGSEISERIIMHRGARIGYFRLWAGTQPNFRKALALAARRAASEADALILDLRDGVGGAGPEYLEPFFPRKRKPPIYGKPAAALINGGTRSGKEWIAHLLQGRAVLVGTRTRGYFLGGRVFDIAPRFLLYLAVRGNDPEGVDLEGRGVSPDVEVPFDYPYSAGADPQLARALDLLADQVVNARS